MQQARVLIFPGGTENALEIRQALKGCKEVVLFSCSHAAPNQAFYAYDNNFVLPDVRCSAWLEELNQVLRQQRIEFIYPANSLVIDALNGKRNALCAKVVLPGADTIAKTRSKKQTLIALEGKLPLPRCYRDRAEIERFPVFVKPDSSYGSQGVALVRNPEGLAHTDFTQELVQEYLPGDEYTIDCFTTQQGRLLFCQGRKRVRIRMGTSMHAELVDEYQNQVLQDYARIIQDTFQITGAWFFQMKEDDAGWAKLLEVDIRIAGTMALNRVRGLNFPLLTLLDFAGYEVEALVHDYEVTIDRCLQNRYRHSIEYQTVYVDLDDTLVVHDRLNTDLIKFLYQCVNKGKRIVLLSKSQQADPEAYLKSWKLSELFDEKIWLREEQDKADFITDPQSIFIDDSFSQRLVVFQRHRIYTFDNSMIEVLLEA